MAKASDCYAKALNSLIGRSAVQARPGSLFALHCQEGREREGGRRRITPDSEGRAAVDVDDAKAETVVGSRRYRLSPRTGARAMLQFAESRFLRRRDRRDRDQHTVKTLRSADSRMLEFVVDRQARARLKGRKISLFSGTVPRRGTYRSAYLAYLPYSPRSPHKGCYSLFQVYPLRPHRQPWSPAPLSAPSVFRHHSLKRQS